MRIFYLHIPKTGGRSIHRFFKELLQGHHCIDHLEQVQGWAQMPDEFFKELSYLSGHIPFPQIVDRLIPKAEWFTFTIVRDPFEHLISHLSWTRNLVDHPQRFAKTPAGIQALSLNLRKIDFSDLSQVEAFLAAMPPIAHALFDNRQIRYFSNSDDAAFVDAAMCHSALEIADQISFIGIFEKIEECLRHLCQVLFPDRELSKVLPHENHHNPKIIIEPEMKAGLQDLMEPLVRFDSVLFHEVRRRFALVED